MHLENPEAGPTAFEAFGRRQPPRDLALTQIQHRVWTAFDYLRKRSRVILPHQRVQAVADALMLNAATVRTHLAKARAKGWS